MEMCPRKNMAWKKEGGPGRLWKKVRRRCINGQEERNIITTGVSKHFYKGSDSKYFRFCED